IADHLREAPHIPEELAKKLSVHPQALTRVLRALASFGIFREEKGKYHLTPLAEPLCVDAPDSVHPWAIMVGENWHRDAWSGLLDTVRSGESAFERTHGMNTFQYFTEHPEAGAVFHAAMGSFTRQVAEPLLTAYDFSQS